ncbi:hypothetical protein LIER_12662 [Lithospermum erythrorhizon]|uniref:Uncharacterized protein n=1 Tax=Lithospermum erythrorhizon TaxID=34254 RepID=A0AAV3PWQ0_LITER
MCAPCMFLRRAQRKGPHMRMFGVYPLIKRIRLRSRSGVAVQRLYVDPHYKPIKQKQWTFLEDKEEAIWEEGNKLLGADDIRELLFPTWLANVVLVPKPNGTWRMSTDFTSINKACPKDCYPLSNIDRLVDSSVSYKVVDFLDVFGGYH